MPGYFIAHYKVHDEEKYGQYMQSVMPTLGSFNVKALVAGHDHEPVEGDPDSNTVVLEFDSVDAAKAWYNSEAYQAVINLRLEATEGWAIFSDQFTPPQ